MAEFTAPALTSSPGLVWAANGLPAHPGGLAVRRTTAVLAACTSSALDAATLRDAREVTLLPTSTAASDLPATLNELRAAAPQAVLRLEWWLEDAVSLEPMLVTLRNVQPLFIHAVVTAPEQITGIWPAAVTRLLGAGVPVAAVLVLRAGGIEHLETVRALCLGLLKCSVRPYVMVDGAWLRPEERVPREACLKLVRGLRGWISGLAVPQLVEESLQGVRTPMIPPYVTQLDETGVEVENFEGRRLRYTNPPERDK